MSHIFSEGHSDPLTAVLVSNIRDRWFAHSSAYIPELARQWVSGERSFRCLCTKVPYCPTSPFIHIHRYVHSLERQRSQMTRRIRHLEQVSWRPCCCPSVEGIGPRPPASHRHVSLPLKCPRCRREGTV